MLDLLSNDSSRATLHLLNVNSDVPNSVVAVGVSMVVRLTVASIEVVTFYMNVIVPERLKFPTNTLLYLFQMVVVINFNSFVHLLNLTFS